MLKLADNEGYWSFCFGTKAGVKANDETRDKIDWWEDIAPKLASWETMTWAAIQSAVGGRKHGNNHHFVPVSEMTSKAQKRLKEIQQEDVSELFSFRVNQRIRIYGIRDRRVFKLIWYDRHHGDNSCAVYPVKK